MSVRGKADVTREYRDDTDPKADIGVPLPVRLFWPRQRRRSADILAAWVVAPALGRQFLDELRRIPRQEALRVPGSDGPSSDRYPAMHDNRHPNARPLNPYRGRNHRN